MNDQQLSLKRAHSPAAWLRALWKFSRPHTIVGTTLSVLGLYTIAYAHALKTGAFAGGLQLAGLWLAWLSCIGANVYIVGLNQLMDVEIDRINKPDLPLASGAFSLQTGRLIVAGSVLLALLIAFQQGSFLLVTVLVSLAIGTAYSLPPIRLKRFHFWAAACIFTVRGVVVNLFLYLHFNGLLTGRGEIPPQVWALTAFIFGFSLVIAWFKDIPDMAGDGRFQIATLALKLGAGNVFALGRGLLAACYAGLIVAGLAGLPGVNGAVLAVTHAALLALMGWRGRRVEPGNKVQTGRYYRFVWRLFFVEYLVYPLACLAAI